jgi:hypothetical protein
MFNVSQFQMGREEICRIHVVISCHVVLRVLTAIQVVVSPLVRMSDGLVGNLRTTSL